MNERRWHPVSRVRLLLAGVLLLAVGGAGGRYLMRDRPVGCDGPELRVTVLAAPDIAPALSEVAARFNVEPHVVGGRCARVTIATSDPMAVAGDLEKGRTVGADGWVPDSSMWLGRVRAAARRSAAAADVAPGASVATSPVVFAVAAGSAGRGIVASWRLVVGPPRHLSVRILDPSRNAAGAAAVLAARPALRATPRTAPGTRPGRPARRTTSVRRGTGLRQVRRAPDLARLYAAFAGHRSLIVATEQSVVGYDAAHPGSPATVLVPREGTILLDHPLASIIANPLRGEAIEAFRWTLRAQQALQTFERHGFRGPDGGLDRPYAARFGLRPRLPKLLPQPTPASYAKASA